MGFSEWIERQADFTPGKVAIRFGDRSLTYTEFAAAVRSMGRALVNELGVGAGDRVAYLGYNSPEIIVLLFACARVGAILMPLNWRLAGPEHVYMLCHAAPTAVFVGADFVAHVQGIRADIGAARLVSLGDAPQDWAAYADLQGSGHEPARKPNAEAPILLCYTSGTTGAPKGALLSQNALFWNAVNATHMHDLTSRDVVLTTLPMFHVGGLNIQTVPALHAGATVVIHERFEVGAFLDSLARDGITLTVLVPTMMRAVLDDPRWPQLDKSRLRLIAIGSTIVPAQIIRAVIEHGVPLIQVYGMTETAPIAAYMPPNAAAARPGSTGKAAIHCELRLADATGGDVPVDEKGEILIRGPNVMSGYWNDPEATRAAFCDGWFRSGDIAHFDAEGFLYVDGRSKDVIVSGGENVYPALVENVLDDCPALAEVAVVGAADDYWGEIVVAVVVVRPGCAIDSRGVIDFCEGRIAHFERPREVLVVDALPRNAVGKVVKADVRRLAAERLLSSGAYQD